MDIDKNEYEDKIIPLINNTEEKNLIESSIYKGYILNKKYDTNLYSYYGNPSDIYNYWKYIYRRGYTPKKVYSPYWLSMDDKTIKEFIDDVKNNRGNYLLSQWYYSLVVISKSFSFDK